ncbi:MAG: pentapeptide repeat-containing protein [Granulosicoccus sp.]
MNTVGLTSRALELPKTDSEYETKPLVETPEFGSELGKLYMQYGDGSEATGTKKDGVVDLGEARSLDTWVGEQLDKNPQSQLLIDAKALTDFVVTNFNTISGSVGGDVSASEIMQVTNKQQNLTGPRLTGQTFREQSLSNANLENADFRSASLVEVDLSGSNLRGADFSGAFMNAVDLSGADLTGAKLPSDPLVIWYDDNTVFPKGFYVNPDFFFEKDPNNDLLGEYVIDESGTFNSSDMTPNAGIRVKGNNLDVTINQDAGLNPSSYGDSFGPGYSDRNWVFIDAVNNSTVAVNGGDEKDVVSILQHNSYRGDAQSAVNMNVDVKAGGGDDEVIHQVAEGNSSGHITIDGGDGYDVFQSDFLTVEGSTVVKNEDGSYTIHAGDQVIEVKNFEGFYNINGQNSEIIPI